MADAGWLVTSAGAVELAIGLGVLRRRWRGAQKRDVMRRELTGATGGAADAGAFEIVARLSDSCSNCRWVVPTLNELVRAAPIAPGTQVTFAAEIAGDATAFVAETSLAWPVREWSPRLSQGPERLPRLVVTEVGVEEPVMAVEAEDIDTSVGELIRQATGVGFDDTVVDKRDAVLRETLQRSSDALRELGHLAHEIRWDVRAAGVTAAVEPSSADAVIGVSRGTAQALVDGRLEIVIAILQGAIGVHGSADAAAAALVGWAVGTATAQQYGDFYDLGAPAGPGGMSLSEVPRPVAAAAYMRALDPMARSVATARLCEHHRSVSEADARASAEVLRRVVASTG